MIKLSNEELLLLSNCILDKITQLRTIRTNLFLQENTENAINEEMKQLQFLNSKICNQLEDKKR